MQEIGNVKILFLSGYSPDLLQDRGIFDSSEEVLIKPLHPLKFSQESKGRAG
jgi:hypothetical protein